MDTPPLHRIDGMTVAAADLPAALRIEAFAGRPDWTVSLGPPADALPSDGIEWTGDTSFDGHAWARFGRAGAERIVRLERVLHLAARPDARTAALRPAPRQTRVPYLFRRAMPYLAVLSGRVALHAACLGFDAGAVLVCGESGQGKSTLALAFDASGRPLLADDHIVLTDEDAGGDGLVAHRSWPHADIAPDARHTLRPDLESSETKASAPLLSPRPVALPVRRLVFLERGDAASLDPLSRPEALMRLLRDVMFVADPAEPAETHRHLDTAGRLVETAACATLRVPRGLDRLRDAMDDIATLLDPVHGDR